MGLLIYTNAQPDSATSRAKPRYATLEEMEKAVKEIQHELGEDRISTDYEDLRLHGYSEWSSVNIERLPVAVAFPQSTEQVAAIARICDRYQVPMSEYNHIVLMV
jgi:D-lactate dehydrogenase (cytochrome)